MLHIDILCLFIIIVFKQGDEALNWYGVISGSLDVQISQTGRLKVSFILIFTVHQT